jgi:hypothetical protein
MSSPISDRSGRHLVRDYFDLDQKLDGFGTASGRRSLMRRDTMHVELQFAKILWCAFIFRGAVIRTVLVICLSLVSTTGTTGQLRRGEVLILAELGLGHGGCTDQGGSGKQGN